MIIQLPKCGNETSWKCPWALNVATWPLHAPRLCIETRHLAHLLMTISLQAEEYTLDPLRCLAPHAKCTEQKPMYVAELSGRMRTRGAQRSSHRGWPRALS